MGSLLCHCNQGKTNYINEDHAMIEYFKGPVTVAIDSIAFVRTLALVWLRAFFDASAKAPISNLPKPNCGRAFRVQSIYKKQE